ncbi:MAG: DUF898 domain-containing protein [Erysipelothrix sp.]|nr:DUF898 domain-containing protein [Erysipelothrix sp.]
MNESYFEGGLAGLVLYTVLGWLVTVITLGICAPWAITMLESWKVRNTVIDGRRLYFTGSAVGLFGKYIVWLILTFITLGIYGFWLGIKLQQWKTEHTHFV